MRCVKGGAAFRTAVGMIVFAAIFALLFTKAQQILKLNMGHRGTDNVNGFYAEADHSIDVLVIGASTAFCTVDPLTLYEDYGITAYDFCSSAQPFELSYLYMQEALKTQKPKVIALEMLSVVNELNVKKAENLNYGLTDMPFSLTKAAGLYDMFREDKGTGLSYLIPLVQYKDRWQELERLDFTGTDVNYSKGAYTPDQTPEQPLDFSSYYEEETFEIPQRNQEIFERMVKLCRDNQISLLLFKSPNIGWSVGRTKAVQELADRYGLLFIDYFALLDPLGIDCGEDFRDNTHLNRYGAKKATDYLGEFLTAHYELADHRKDQQENSWDRALILRAHDRADEAVQKAQGLPEYMSVMPYQGHTVVFSTIGNCDNMGEFLGDLAALYGLDREKLQRGGSFALVDGECVSGLVGPSDPPWRWENGPDTIQITGYSVIYNREIYQLADDGVTILVYDKDWGRLVDIAGFEDFDPAHAIRPKE